MKDLSKDMKMNCENFLNAVEGLTANGPGAATLEEVLAAIPEEMRTHRVSCASCEEALQDYVETGRIFGAMKAELPKPGPWFATRVMAAIGAREEEIEEKKEGVWISVRRLAPRMVAFAAVLLVVGGSWLIEVRHAERSNRPAMRPVESLFEGSPSGVASDDVVAGMYYEEQVP